MELYDQAIDMNMDLPPLLSSFSSSSLVSFPLKWSIISAHPLVSVLCFCFISYIIHLIIIRRLSSKHKQSTLLPQPPKVPGAWPLLGHIDLLTLPFDKCGAIADTYGPIYRIQLGIRDVVVINNWEMEKQCFTTHDKSYSNRPKSFALKYCFDNDYSFFHMPFGSLWRDIRKVTVFSLFSNLRLEMQRHIRTSEVNLWFNHLYMLWTKQTAPAVSVELNSWIQDVVFSVIFGITIGTDDDVHGQQQNGGLSRKDTGKKYKKVLDETQKLMDTTLAVSDLIPCLEWYDKLRGVTTVMEKKAKEMNSFQDMWIQEYHRRHLSSKSVDNNVSDEDDQVKPYMDRLLSAIHKNPQFVGLDSDAIVKASCQDILFGGYLAVSSTLPWAIFFVLNNRHVLDKARKELDENIGKERQVEESDLKQLPYIPAIMKETLRLYKAKTPMIRFVTEDCEVGGFHVKAGTNVLINQWKIHRDPGVWPEPLVFKPERFLVGSSNADVDLKGQHFEFIPFGTGRRMCPAPIFALPFMHLVLARLIHGFELNISNPDGTADTSAGASIPVINGKIAHLQVAISPRLASEAYSFNAIGKKN